MSFGIRLLPSRKTFKVLADVEGPLTVETSAVHWNVNTVLGLNSEIEEGSFYSWSFEMA